MGFVKTLNFHYSRLPKEGYLIFTFDDQEVKGHKMYSDFFPLVWRVAHLQTGRDSVFTVTYHQLLAFATGKIRDGQIVASSTVADIQFKQDTILIKHNGVVEWSDPRTVPGIADDDIAMRNATGSQEGVLVGIHPEGRFINSLLYMDAANEAFLEVKPTPRLRIYSVVGMREGSVIKSEITAPRLWDHRLEENIPDNWVITYDDVAHEYKICPE